MARSGDWQDPAGRGIMRSPMEREQIMKTMLLLACLATLGSQTFAMKNRQRSFRESCDTVWEAAVSVAKTHDYRIVSISKEDHVISVSVGGVWSGERLISLSLSPDPERGCLATVQSRFSGLAHSDAPDLLSRVAVALIARNIDPQSKEFRRYQSCVESPTPDSKCEENLRKQLAKVPPETN